MEQKYGGHLGFYEGGLVYPDPLTWLDRLVVQLSDALVIYSSVSVKGKEEISTEKLELPDLKTKDAFSDSDTISDDTSSSTDDESTTLITKSQKSNNRPHFICRRRTVSGPQVSLPSEINIKVAMKQ